MTSWFSMLPPKITFYSIFDGSVECTSHARFRFHCNRNRTSVARDMGMVSNPRIFGIGNHWNHLSEGDAAEVPPKTLQFSPIDMKTKVVQHV